MGFELLGVELELELEVALGGMCVDTGTGQSRGLLLPSSLPLCPPPIIKSSMSIDGDSIASSSS